METTERVRVETPARLHMGFLNLSAERKRLYGGVGVGVDSPRAVVEAKPANGVEATHDQEMVSRAVDALGVDGVDLSFEQRIPRHVGLGSGTQHALAVLYAVGNLYGVEPTHEDVRSLGRGRRSGVGVGVFEKGGLVIDAGHPTACRRENRSVPDTIARHPIPSGWRFITVVPENGGFHGDEEGRLMEEVTENADPGAAEELAGAVVSSLLPGIAESDISAFGEGLETVERVNGRWYSNAKTQKGEYTEGSAEAVECLREHEAVKGVGQSSWGTAYGVTASEDPEGIASCLDTDSSSVSVVCPDNRGARITRLP